MPIQSPARGGARFFRPAPGARRTPFAPRWVPQAVSYEVWLLHAPRLDRATPIGWQRRASGSG